MIAVACGPLEEVGTVDADDWQPPPTIDARTVPSADAAPPLDAIFQEIDAPTPPPPDAPEPPRLRVTGADQVNLRLGPSSDWPIITTVPAGCLVDPMGPPESGYMPVSWHRIPGWIHGRYLESVPAGTADCAF